MEHVNPNMQPPTNPNGCLSLGQFVGHKGRPPEVRDPISNVPTLERPGQPLEDGRSLKKQRNKGTGDGSTSDLEITDMDVEGGEALGSEGSTQGVSVSPAAGGGEVKPSYARMVTGIELEGVFPSVLRETDSIEVPNEDCIVDNSGSITKICFSDCVHDQIDQNMKLVLIIHLLDREIGYKTMLSRVLTLWKPKGDVQLVDMDNNYYLAKFTLEEDYIKALIEGPWTIYGSYLMVQPWSRSFLTTEKCPSQILVWVRLPSLPYHYYSKALFRRIADAIGKVVKKLEYEGLDHICFKCGTYGHSSDRCDVLAKVEAAATEATNQEVAQQGPSIESENVNLFGPWMVVERKKRKPWVEVKESTKEVKGVGMSSKSSSAVLAENQVMDEQDNAPVVAMGSNKGKQPLASTIKSRGHKDFVPTASYLASNQGNVASNHAGTSTGKVNYSCKGQDWLEDFSKQLEELGKLKDPMSHAQIKTRLVEACLMSNDEEMVESDVEELNLIALLEAQISGRSADRVINKLNFPHSFRVEAHGFSGGISVLWSDAIEFEILSISNQFVHGRSFWHALISLDPGGFVPWFHGLPFTWSRRCFHQRLDRSAFLESQRGIRPFHFLAAWNEHPNFQDFLQSTWAEDKDFDSNMRDFTTKLMDWNLNVFVHIGRNKIIMLARLRGIDKALSLHHSYFLCDLEDQLREELNAVLKQEESFWCQKSCSRWVIQGDRRPLENEEVRAAFNSMAPYKSPGIDDFHAAFYKRNWSVVGNVVLYTGNFRKRNMPGSRVGYDQGMISTLEPPFRPLTGGGDRPPVDHRESPSLATAGGGQKKLNTSKAPPRRP
ncbi:hypothetical protein F3Y22_tig00011824pilonHSYRG00027 [Hibiscus syriacus]|uniref:CCHC-type domain-containing protein n=1 Tax=Hibiscus syriacus TaxID=106335 RepID=A0A6A3C814_HIBSY|nr:hypothetical protein F3Y22_tig00011824pilonHSYRG00027 [Hibiscus syriacus]